MAIVAAAIIGAAAIGAIANYYQAEKARGATERELKKVRDMFDRVKPPELKVNIEDPPEYIEQLEVPQLDFSRVTPEDFEMVGQFAPQLTPYIAEQNPKLVEDTAASKEGRQAQLDALRQMKQISESGTDPIQSENMRKIYQKAASETQSAGKSLLQQEARRGTLGSTKGFAERLQASSSLQQQAAEMGGQEAAQAYQRRMQALRDMAGLGGSITQQERSLQSRNADIINAFNQRTSQRMQAHQQQQADAINAAALRNLGVQQDLANRNTAQANEAQRYNLERQNKLLQQQAGLQNQATQYANQMAAQRWGQMADLDATRRGVAQQNYANQLDVARSKAGLSTTGINYMNQAARDKMAATQGLAEAVGKGAVYYGQQQNVDDKKSDII